MSAPALKAYVLASAAQWSDGARAGAVRVSDASLQPFHPYAQPGRKLGPATGARLVALGADGSAWWRGPAHQRTLYSLSADAVTPVEREAPPAVMRATLRLVAGLHVLWIAAPDRKRLHCLAQDDLCAIATVELPGTALDLADAGKDGVWLLLEHHEGLRIMQLSCGGAPLHDFTLPAGWPAMHAIAYLRDNRRLALLTQTGDAVWFVDPCGQHPARRLPLASVVPDAHATRLASDGRALLFAATTRDVLVFDAAGDLLTTVPLDGAPAALAARGRQLLVAGAHGATLFSNAGPATTEAACDLITPVLHSPRRGDAGGWLRAELSLELPRGATVTVQYAETDDAEVRAAAVHIARDAALTAPERYRQLSRLLEGWSTAVQFTGTGDGAATLAAPLFDVRAEYLWLRLRLQAPAGVAAMPRLERLRVLYPDRSLVQALPAIYRNGERQDFLRTLVGVLETTTQDLDHRIAKLGQLIAPETADDHWLDYTARWLGLPWDDGLAIDQKRALMKAAPRILAARGTRTALEAMLACLFGHDDDGRRMFRVRDSSDLAPLQVGATGLPALLGGLPSSAAALGRKAILGQARLPDPAAEGSAAPPPARITIEITASMAQRRQADRWLPAMIESLMPVTARMVLRWRRPGTGITVGDTLVLDDQPAATLGTDAVVNAARLPDRRVMRLTDAGLATGFPLR